jgi:kinetochore protein NDC80
MVSYLTNRGYADASSLNVKQLVTNGPSGRDFQNIMTFLFRRVDPTFHSTTAATATAAGSNNNQRSDEIAIKFEDEVSMAFRCLGYPFPISKTGLVAVGSPHTWPALIAAIDWLVDLLTIRDEEEVHDWGPDDTASADGGVLTLDASLELIDIQFHHFLRKSMVAFLNDNNDECAELEGALLDTFQKDHLRVEENLTALDNECGLMKEEIASLSAEVDGYVIYSSFFFPCLDQR